MNRSQFLKVLSTSLFASSKYKLFAESLPQKKEVIIIGAGIAGLAAGRKLVSEGFQVTILEGRNRIGGRIWTDKSMGQSVEMGANFIHGFKGNPISKLTEKLKLKTNAVEFVNSEICGTKTKITSSEESLQIHSYQGVRETLLGGFSEIPNILSNGLNIKTSHIVSKISYDKKVKILTNQGEYTADYAIITVPLGVLKKKKIQFSPPLPEKKVESIESIEFGTMNKIFLKFPKIFWSQENQKFTCIASSPEDQIEFWNLNSSESAPILSGIVSGNKAILLEKRSKKEITKDCMEILKKVFGNKIPLPLEETHSKWNTDPFSYGAGSYFSTNSNPKDYDQLSESINDLLYFAGEATNSIYPSTVHGAYLSGEREANQIIASTKV